MSEFDNLKVGDKVYIENDGSYRTAKVSRLTATQIIVVTKKIDGTDLEWKFKKTGRIVGGDAWSRIYLVIPTLELDEKVAIMNLTKKVRSYLQKAIIPNDRSELNLMAIFLENYQPKKDYIINIT